ncbi:MAG TPA: PUA domain-containing protein [Candidatus Saccharimonadales bacterium]
MKRVVIKLSSGLLVSNGVIQHQWLEALGRLIADLQRDGHDLWLVTSGAAALIKQEGKSATTEQAIIEGQRKLFALYEEAFFKAGLQVAEVLVAKEDFVHRKSYLEIRDNFNDLAKRQVVVLINDRYQTKSSVQQQFSDNDEIAGLIGSLIDAQRVILASTVAGVLKPDRTVINEVEFGDKSWTRYVTKKTSEHGKGGMLLKCIAAEHNSQRGLETIICDGSTIENIRQAVLGKRLGTRFGADRRIAARKRWILDKKDFSRGVIQIDDGLAQVIEEGKAVSLLTVGITSIDGEFFEHDIVAIKHGTKIIGYGETALDATATQKALDQKVSRLLVHYDKYARIRG